MRYKYTPLKEYKDSQEIRILEILPGGGDNLRCTLTHRALPRKRDETRSKARAQTDRTTSTDAAQKNSEPLDYEAVSWTWGYSTKFASIEIQHESGWATLHVRPNLIRALIRLRNTKALRKLWIDAVCINQDNEHEKDLQVAMMADIYGSARNVCIWLGDHENDSEKALNFINEHVSKIGTYEDILENDQYASHWKALAALMIRPWFSRRWVVQEIALARNATLQCGDKVVKWSLFETAVALFQRDAARIAKLYRGSQKSQWDSDLFGDVAAMGASRLVDAKSNLFRRADDGAIIEYRFTLSELVANLSSFDANLPHDMIYAILALARDTFAKTTAHSEKAESEKSKKDQEIHEDGENTVSSSGNPSSQVPEASSPNMNDRMKRNVAKRFQQIIKPQNARIFQVNYKQDFFEVCKQFLAFTIPKTEANNLDILCRPWAPQLPKDVIPLPSWLPSVVNAPFGRRAAEHGPGGYQTTRKNFDPLVGLRTAGTPYYNASRNQRAKNDDWGFGDTEDTKRSLYVTGFELDKISEAESYSTNGDIPVEWFNLAGWDPWQGGDASDPPERFWRTLIADRGPDGTNAPVYYASVFEYAVKNSTPENGIETTELSKRHNPILVEFLKRMKAVVWNRKLFKSERDGHLGLAPKKAKDGDRICILRGYSVPVILRRKSGGSHYEFIGECYLHTMMDGKAIDIQEDSELETVQFELR